MQEGRFGVTFCFCPRYSEIPTIGSADSTGTGGETAGQSGGRLAHRDGGASPEKVPQAYYLDDPGTASRCTRDDQPVQRRHAHIAATLQHHR